jgi:hypothetical protein
MVQAVAEVMLSLTLMVQTCDELDPQETPPVSVKVMG